MRSPGLALLASVVLIAATAPVATARAAPVAPTPTAQPKIDPVAFTRADVVHTLTLSAVTMRPSFHPGNVAEAAISSERLAPTLSERSRRSIQSVAVDRAFNVLRTSRDFSDSTFAGSLLHATIAELGADGTRRFATEYCRYHGIKADQLRTILRAIAARDPGDRNRSSAAG